MKRLVAIILLVTSFQAFALDCRLPENFYGEHYLGYLALSERGEEPILMWWRDEYDDQEHEHDPRYSGMEFLSDDRMFKEAANILRKRKADIYLLAWPDTIYIAEESIKVSIVSIAISKEVPAHKVAYEEISIPSTNKSESNKLGVKSYELGCAANLLK